MDANLNEYEQPSLVSCLALFPDDQGPNQLTKGSPQGRGRESARPSMIPRG